MRLKLSVSGVFFYRKNVLIFKTEFYYLCTPKTKNGI